MVNMRSEKAKSHYFVIEDGLMGVTRVVFELPSPGWLKFEKSREWKKADLLLSKTEKRGMPTLLPNPLVEADKVLNRHLYPITLLTFRERVGLALGILSGKRTFGYQFGELRHLP